MAARAVAGLLMDERDRGTVVLDQVVGSPYAPLVALVVVAGAWMVFQRLAMELRFPLGFDEAVYVSQASYRPHVHWTAPRAYGVPLLVWPLVHHTASTVALRVYVSALTAVGLVASYWPWTKVRAWSAVLAAALFSTLWVSTYYASLAMPNLFTALAAVAAVGYLVRWLDRGSRAGVVACGVAVAVMTLVRPSDSTYIALPLFIALLAIRSWPGRRRIWGATALALGLAVGWGFWVVEAFINFGGPLQRLRDASSQDGGGLRWNFPFYSHVISGPTACCVKVPEGFAVNAWWWLIWPLALLGVWLASGAARRAYLLCVLCAAAVFAQYLFLIKVEAPGPRTLLPVYALLSLPVGAAGMATVAKWRHSALGAVAISCLGLLLALQVVQQHHVLRINVQQQRLVQSVPEMVAGQLRSQGLEPPCVLAGPQLPAIAYQTGCHELPTLPSAAQIAQARSNGTQLAVLLWTNGQITRFKDEYDRVLGVTPRVIPRAHGKVSYLYELTP